MPDGRLHLHHGPIDIIAQSWGDPVAVSMGEARAIERFGSVLAELCKELSELRSEDAPLSGPVAQNMAAAVAPFRPAFITPMAAVAGAVADWVLDALVQPGVCRAYVNNGGDIALHLVGDQTLTCAIAAQPGCPDRITIRAVDRTRGIATSGWRGRSWSLGIADSVTVLAATAAQADAAATMIANAVDLPDHPAVGRKPAQDLQADSDLGARLVTVSVPQLSAADRAEALSRGQAAAETFLRRGLVEGAALFLQGETRVTGGLSPLANLVSKAGANG